MDVQAGAGAFGIGLGHEGRLKAGRTRGGLDDLAQEHGVIGGEERIV